MVRYFVEAYVPRAHAEKATAAGWRIGEAAASLQCQGTSVRYVRTTFLPVDEICFHVVDAGSLDVVRDVCSRAGLGSPRITEAIEVDGRHVPPAPPQ